MASLPKQLHAMQQARSTAAGWTASTRVLYDGEIGVETDTGKFKFGDGASLWPVLAYAGGGGSSGSNDLVQSTWQSSITGESGVGGYQRAPIGSLTGNDTNLPSSSVLQGRGSDPDAIIGSKVVLNIDNKAIFNIANNQRNVKLIDLALDCAARTGATGVKFVGTAPNGTFHIIFDNVVFHNGDLGIDIVSTDNAWQVTGVTMRDCFFLAQAIAGFRANTPNSRYNFIGCSFSPQFSAAQDCIRLLYSGTTMIANCSFGGTNISPKSVDPTFTTFASNVITSTAHGLSTGDVVYPKSSGVFPILAYKERYWVRVVSANTLTLHALPVDAQTGLNIVPLAGGSGTHTLQSSRLITAGRPHSAISLSGSNGTLTIMNCEAENLSYFLHVNGNGSAQFPITLINNLPQAAIYLKSTCTIYSAGNNYAAGAFIDDYGVDARVYSSGDRIATPDGLGASYADIAGRTATFPYHLANFTGTSRLITQGVAYEKESWRPRDTDKCIMEMNIHDAYINFYGDTNAITVNAPDYSQRKATISPSGSPVFRTNQVNAKAVARLINTNSNYFQVTGMDGYKAYHVFKVMKKTAAPNSSGNTWGTAGSYDHYPFTDGSCYGAFATDTRKGAAAPVVDTTTWHVAEFWSAPNDWGFAQNGQIVQQVATNTVAMPATIKFGYNGLIYPDEDVAAILLFRDKLTDDERAKVYNYIHDFYNIAQNTPATGLLGGTTGQVLAANSALATGYNYTDTIPTLKINSATGGVVLYDRATGLDRMQMYSPATSQWRVFDHVLSQDVLSISSSIFTVGRAFDTITIADAKNIVLNTTTGTKIGTATSQKLGFYNSTPVTQRTDTGALTDSTTGTADGTVADVTAAHSQSILNNNFADLIAKINAIRTVLRDLGLMS